jgi:hypothetical protein
MEMLYHQCSFFFTKRCQKPLLNLFQTIGHLVGQIPDGWTQRKQIFPAVVSSEKYREYYQNELDKKLLPKSKKKQKSKPIAESSDSDVSVTYNDEDLDVNDIENLNLTNMKTRITLVSV